MAAAGLACGVAGSASAASLQLLGLTGEDWPGLPDGTTVAWLRTPGIAADGTLVAVARLAGAGVTPESDSALFLRPPGGTALQLAAREGMTLANGSPLAEIHAAQATAAGTVFVAGTLAQPRRQLWWVDTAGTVEPYAQFGGSSEPSFVEWALGSAGSFVAASEGNSVLLFPASVANPVLSRGDPAPGFGAAGVFSSFQSLQANGSSAAFLAWVTDGLTNLTGVYAVDLASGEASPSLRAREGSASRSGEVFGQLWSPVLLSDGAIVFEAESVDAAGFPTVGGLWSVDEAGTIAPLLLRGHRPQNLPDWEVGAIYWHGAGHDGDTVLIDVTLVRDGEGQEALLVHDRATGDSSALVQQGQAVGAESLLLDSHYLAGFDLNERGQVGFVGMLNSADGTPAATAAMATPPGGGPPQVLLRDETLVAGIDCRGYRTLADMIAGGGWGGAGHQRGMSADGELWLTAGLDADGDGAADATALFVASPEGDSVALGCPSGASGLFRDGFEW